MVIALCRLHCHCEHWLLCAALKSMASLHVDVVFYFTFKRDGGIATWEQAPTSRITETRSRYSNLNWNLNFSNWRILFYAFFPSPVLVYHPSWSIGWFIAVMIGSGNYCGEMSLADEPTRCVWDSGNRAARRLENQRPLRPDPTLDSIRLQHDGKSTHTENTIANDEFLHPNGQLQI